MHLAKAVVSLTAGCKVVRFRGYGMHDYCVQSTVDKQGRHITVSCSLRRSNSQYTAIFNSSPHGGIVQVKIEKLADKSI